MHARPLALASIALLLAGCASPPEPSAEAASYLAYVDAPEESGPNRTILVVHEERRAQRLTYLADGSWQPRLAPGLEHPREELLAIFERSPSWERGGLVVRVERGHVGEDALAKLRPLLAGDWPAPFLPEGEPHPWYRPLVLARGAPAAVTEATPEGDERLTGQHARLGELSKAFAELRASFVAEEETNVQLPYEQAFDGCLRASTSASPAAATVGDVITITVDVSTCGTRDVRIDPASCAMAPTAHVQVSGSAFPMFAVLPASEEPNAAYAIDLACRGEAEPLDVPAGGKATLTRRWNGTFAACSAPDACEFRAAQQGEYGVFTFASGQLEAAPSGVTLFARDAEATPVLYVREFDWVNTTSSGGIEGYFGPHCSPVGFTPEPAALTLRYYDVKSDAGVGAIVRDWRAGERPQHAYTFSADRMDVQFLKPNATLASPFDHDLPLVEVTREGDAFVVNGTRLAVGDTRTLRFERAFETEEGRFDTVSILEMENAGDAAVLWQRVGGCA